jgi:hypothetical protein
LFDGARNWATPGVIHYLEIFFRREAASSNKALERYLQGKARYAKKVSEEILKMQKDKSGEVIKFKKKS